MEIKDRFFAEKNHAHNEESFRFLAENIQDYIVRFDPELVCIYANNSFLQKVNIPHELLVGTNLREFPLFDASQLDYLEKKICITFETGFSYQTQLILEEEDDTTTYLDLKIVPEKNSDDNPISALCVFRDISSVVIIQKELEQIKYENHINAQKKAESESEKNRNQLKKITDNVPVLIALVDRTYKYIFANKAYEELYRIPLAEIIGSRTIDVIGEEAFNRACPYYEKAFSGETATYENTITNRDGKVVIIKVTYTPYYEEDGITGIIILTQDITNQKEMELKLKQERDFSDTAINSLPGIFYLISIEGRFIRWNQNFEKISEYTPDEIRQMSPLDFFAGQDKDLIEKSIGDVFVKGSAFAEAHFVSKSGNSHPFYFTGILIDIEGKSNLIGVGIDITERKKAEEKILHLAQYDLLTDIPGRSLFFQRLENALKNALANNSIFAIMFIDLDNFKPINDTLGHAVGDFVLQQMAKRMAMCIRTNDTVARIGGDEFVVLLPGLNSREDAGKTASRILKSLNLPLRVGDQTLSISSSIGVVVFPEHGDNENKLVRNADVAMYYAKNSGGNTVMFYDDKMKFDLKNHQNQFRTGD